MVISRNGATSRRFLIGLLLIVLVAGWLRAIPMGQSLWLDELHTSWVVRGTFSEVADRAAMGNQGPLYFWAVWLVANLVPVNEWTLRGLSWLASCALVGSLGWIVRRWTARIELGWLAAGLAAMDPNAIYFGREARPYACVALLALWHVESFRKRLADASPSPKGHSPNSRAAWIVLSWALFYTHFTSILLLPAELAFLLLRRATGRRATGRHRPVRWTSPSVDSDHDVRWTSPSVDSESDSDGDVRWTSPSVDSDSDGDGRGRPSYETITSVVRRQWLFDLAWILGGCAVAMPQIWQIAQRRGNWSQFVKPQGWISIWTIYPCNLYVATPIVTAVSIAAWVKWRGGTINTRRIGYFGPLLACWYFVPVVSTWLLTHLAIAPLFFRRYVWISVVPLFIHVPLWGSLLRGRLERSVFLGVVLLVAGAFWLTRPPRTWSHHSNEDWRSAVASVNADTAKHDWPVFLHAGLIEDHQLSEASSIAFREYCTFALRGLYPLTDRTAVVVPLPSDRADQVPISLRATRRTSSGFWFVDRGKLVSARRVVDQWQRSLKHERIHFQIESAQQFPGVAVMAVKVVSPP